MSRTDPEDRFQPDILTRPTEIAWPGGVTHIGLNVDVHRLFWGNVNSTQFIDGHQSIGYSPSDEYPICWSFGEPDRPPFPDGPVTGNWLREWEWDEALVTNNSLAGYNPRSGWSATSGTVLGASSITDLFPMSFSYSDWEWKGGTFIQPGSTRAPAFEYTFEESVGSIIMDTENKPLTDLGNGTGTPYRTGSSGSLVAKGWAISGTACRLNYFGFTSASIVGFLSDEYLSGPFDPLEFGEVIESAVIPLNSLSVRRTVGENVITYSQIGFIPNGQGCRVLLKRDDIP